MKNIEKILVRVQLCVLVSVRAEGSGYELGPALWILLFGAGGYPKGRIIEIYGPESSGNEAATKTTSWFVPQSRYT